MRRIPSSQDIEDLYFQPARECLMRGDRNGFIRLHGQGQVALQPYSNEVPNLRWLEEYHSRMSDPTLLPDSPRNLWYHEKSHCSTSQRWGVGAKPMIVKLRGNEHAMYTHLSMRDVS